MTGQKRVSAFPRSSHALPTLFPSSSFACCPFVVRSLSVRCPFVVRSLNEQRTCNNRISFALQSDMYRGNSLGVLVLHSTVVIIVICLGFGCKDSERCSLSSSVQRSKVQKIPIPSAKCPVKIYFCACKFHFRVCLMDAEIYFWPQKIYDWTQTKARKAVVLQSKRLRACSRSAKDASIMALA